ncbi:MAG: hypothetical protein ABSG91_09195 [Syntrophobacteraceae bacterium]
MGKSGLLTCLEKRDMLNRSAVSADLLLRWGKLYEEEGQINDAIDFYERSNSTESLGKLLASARLEGDAFVYARIMKALGRQAPADEWISLGKRAAELGKDAFAREAFKRGGLETAEVAQSQKSQTP